MNVRPDIQTSSSQEPALGLARFVELCAGDAIPAEVRVRACHHILDAVGIAMASGKFDFAHRTLSALQGLGEAGTVPVIGLPSRLSMRDAALMNGLLCHGLDFDDTHLDGVIHPTASVFPAVLSAAIKVGASGRDLVTAYVLGVEAATRIAAAAQGRFHHHGFHPTGVVGVFGCALAAGRLFGLTSKELASAQGVALSFAAGSLEFLEDGAWNKRIHPGWAAQGGIVAAALAKQGFAGITRPYSGRYGLFRSYLAGEGMAKPEKFTDALGSDWQLMKTAIKPIPACHFTHAAVDAALALRAKGVSPEMIASGYVLVPEPVIAVVCEPQSNKRRPANSYDAQFSIPFLVAAALVRGKLTLAEIEPDALSNPTILALAQKISYEIDPRSPFPRAYSGELVLRLTDGRELRHREEINRGAPDRPLTNGEIVEKFRSNAMTAASRDTVQRVETAVLGLDGDVAVRTVADALGG